MKTITIGIPTFNGSHRLNNCLESIEKWNDVPEGCKVDILLLDDGSHEPKRSESFWVASHHNVPIIPHKENMGISKSWNDLCQYGNSDYIVLLNDDILVSRNWLTAGLFFLEKNKQVGAVGWDQYFIIPSDVDVILEADEPPEIYRHPETKELLTKSQRPYSDQPYRIMAATGSCFMFSREKYEVVDGFDERFISFYEETDFGTKLAEQGYPSYMLHYPRLYHLWSATFAENEVILKPSKIMDESRRKYREKWDGDTDQTNPRFMGKIPEFEVDYLTL